MRKRQVFSCLLACLLVSTAGRGAEGLFESGGQRLRYVTQGEGETVVLLHGYASGIDHGWRQNGLLDGLAGAGFQVVALDQRGHGRSDKPHRAAYGLAMVEDLRRLFDHLGIDRAHLVGYSMGATIANLFRHRYPERLKSTTLAGFGHPRGDIPSEFSDEFADLVETNLVRFELSEDNDARALAWLALQWHEWSLSEEELGTNEIPTLALIGEEDDFLADTRSLALRMPNVTLGLVPGDHERAPAQPEFLGQLIEFLSAGR